MKKIIYLSMCSLLLTTSAIGCTSANSIEETSESSILSSSSLDSVLSEVIETTGAPDSNYDLDISVIADEYEQFEQAYFIATYYEDYLDQTIKMSGSFQYYQNEETGKHYYGCLVGDEEEYYTIIEFEPVDELAYPEDFPEVGTSITVGGTYSYYMEDDVQHLYLANASFTVNDEKTEE